MRRMLILLGVMYGLFADAQTFYEPEDMQVAFTQFRQPLSWGDDCIAPTWSYAYIDGKGVMCATWLIQGKFATVYFAAKKTDIGVCGAYGITEVDELNSSVSLQLQYSQGEY